MRSSSKPCRLSVQSLPATLRTSSSTHYCNLLVGKMNQEDQCFEVHWCEARDIRREDIRSIIEGLAAWKSVAESALELVATQQNSCRAQAEAYKQQEAETAAMIKENKSLRLAEDEGKRRGRAW